MKFFYICWPLYYNALNGIKSSRPNLSHGWGLYLLMQPFAMPKWHQTKETQHELVFMLPFFFKVWNANIQITELFLIMKFDTRLETLRFFQQISSIHSMILFKPTDQLISHKIIKYKKIYIKLQLTLLYVPHTYSLNLLY